MIIFPDRNTRSWKKSNNSDVFGSLYVTKDISLDEEGYLSTSGRAVKIFAETDDADFGGVLAVTYFGDTLQMATSDKYFTLDDTSPLGSAPAEDTASDVADTTINSDQAIFDDKLFVAEASDINYKSSGGTWADTAITIASGVPHPLAVMRNLNWLLIGSGNTMKVVDTSLTRPSAIASDPVLPSEFVITDIAVGGNLAVVATRHKYGGQAAIFTWDGSSIAFDDAYPISSNIIYSIKPYKSGWVILDGDLSLQYFDGAGFEVLDQFPTYFTSTSFADYDNIKLRSNTLVVDGDLIYVNLNGTQVQGYFPNTPVGVWCYDPKFGLYQRHSQSFTGITRDNSIGINTEVDTTTDIITVTAAPITGTPALYIVSSGSVTPLVSDTIYYVIRLSSTTIKLASSYTNALAGTAINLTAKSSGTFDLTFFNIKDWGITKSSTYAPGYGVFINTAPSIDKLGVRTMFSSDTRNASGSDQDTLNGVVNYLEGRSYVVLPWCESTEVRDEWKNLTIKYNGVVTDLDKIIVKYRTEEHEQQSYDTNNDNAYDITWTDTDTFTSTSAIWANAVAGNEVTILSGVGAGFIAHISSISVSSGTYTVNLDESCYFITASDTAEAIWENWTKIPTTITSTDDNGYKVLPIGRSSKKIQFKIELRGIKPRIEEIIVSNEVSQPIV
jgi:hypothetical protein